MVMGVSVAHLPVLRVMVTVVADLLVSFGICSILIFYN
jgi:hypothetical protein